MGNRLSLYANINGILICFIILKFLNFIKRINNGIGMLFEVISATQHEIAYFFMMVLFFLTAFILQFKVAFGANYI